MLIEHWQRTRRGRRGLPEKLSIVPQCDYKQTVRSHGCYSLQTPDVSCEGWEQPGVGAG